MATISTTGLYEFDPYGNNPNNLIVDEQQALQTPGRDDFYFIIPQAAPFFIATLVVKSSTGQVYVEGVDYVVGHYFVEGINKTGRALAGSIRFLRRDITGIVKLTYQTLGGLWGHDDAKVLQELSNKLVNPLRRSWDELDPSPVAFPPIPHDQRVDELIGFQEVVDEVKNIANALQANAGGALDEHMSDRENPHDVTKVQVGLGNVDNYRTATDADGITGTRSDRFMTPRATRAAINAIAGTPMDTHIDDSSNPHGVTKAQVGLPNTPNYPPATYAETALMIANDRLVTPFVLKAALDRYFQDNVIDEFNVTKESVGLGSVSNYPVATILDTVEGLSDEHYTTPAGVKTAILRVVGDDLNTHIDDTSNPHQVTAEQLGVHTRDEIITLLEGKLDTDGVASDADKVYGLDKLALIAEVSTSVDSSNAQTLDGRTVSDLHELITNSLLSVVNLTVHPVDTYVKIMTRDYSSGTSNSNLPLQLTYVHTTGISSTATLNLPNAQDGETTLVSVDHNPFPIEILTSVEEETDLTIWCKVTAASQTLAINRLVLDMGNNITILDGSITEVVRPDAASTVPVIDPVYKALVESINLSADLL
jgi:hypothetical protein